MMRSARTCYRAFMMATIACTVVAVTGASAGAQQTLFNGGINWSAAINDRGEVVGPATAQARSGQFIKAVRWDDHGRMFDSSGRSHCADACREPDASADAPAGVMLS